MPVISALWETEASKSQGQGFDSSLINMVRLKNTKKKKKYRGVVVHTHNPSYLGG